ncbi:hypothetical protein KSP40_PGU011360 [Platanthera guangdongensis]|uniref:DNA helicase n=1 Tax=Platanthera guangdongensis TaxID=2320717 RepID=A0ABR2LHX0_9ASPA
MPWRSRPFLSQHRPAAVRLLPELLDTADILNIVMYVRAERYTLERNEDANTAASLWPFYFPEAEFAIEDKKFKLVSKFTDFLSSPQSATILSNVHYDTCVFIPIDFKQLQTVCWVDEFYVALKEAPKEALLCMGAAAHMALLLKGKDCHIDDVEKINIRLYNHPDSAITLKNLKSASIGKLVSVRGTVVKVSTVRPLVTQMDFTCAKCGDITTRVFPDGKFSPTVSCSIHGCRSRTFTPIRSSAKTIDFQKIRIQEILKYGTHEEGRVPRTVECELTEDLVDSCIPGDVVTVTGITKVINNYVDIGGGRSKTKNQGLYYLYLEAVSVRNSRSPSVSDDYQPSDSEAKSIMLCDMHTFLPRDLEFIVKFSEDHGRDTFRQIVQSFCPSIYGHEYVKAGITLALFGGVQKYSMDENKVPVRGDIHVIIVGDPGLGKSQLLQAAAAVSPRGIYVCGNTTTNAGLTVAVVKDHMTSDYAFEAGAMVLADRGLCCIDEFDKMSAEHQALLEAMEQQCVSVAKAGLVASLSARTSVLAAANPVGGHYNRAKTVNENLKMSAALLSRFDLVFILLDKPDEVLDKRVSDHIMAPLKTDPSGKRWDSVNFLGVSWFLHSMSPKDTGMLGCVPANTLIKENHRIEEDDDGDHTDVSRYQRLDLAKDKDFIPLPVPLLRKYIAYGRTFIFPRMSRPAAEILQKFYLRLRDHNTSADSTPITARQLESLVRLAEARARVDLRVEITAEDAMVRDYVIITLASHESKIRMFKKDKHRAGGMVEEKEIFRLMRTPNKEAERQAKDAEEDSPLHGNISGWHNLTARLRLGIGHFDTIGSLLKLL